MVTYWTKGCVQVQIVAKCSIKLATLGFKMHLDQSVQCHKCKCCDSITGGLGYIWPHTFYCVKAKVLQCVPSKDITGKYFINRGLYLVLFANCKCVSFQSKQLEKPSWNILGFFVPMLLEQIWCFIGNRWLCEAFCLSRGGEVDSNDFWTPWMHIDACRHWYQYLSCPLMIWLAKVCVCVF